MNYMKNKSFSKFNSKAVSTPSFTIPLWVFFKVSILKSFVFLNSLQELVSLDQLQFTEKIFPVTNISKNL